MGKEKFKSRTARKALPALWAAQREEEGPVWGGNVGNMLSGVCGLETHGEAPGDQGQGRRPLLEGLSGQGRLAKADSVESTELDGLK